MTNTFFTTGDNTLEEMIASIKDGYLLDGAQSGMEDPKHWGIQCMVPWEERSKTENSPERWLAL